jgi:hypothetical protein
MPLPMESSPPLLRVAFFNFLVSNKFVSKLKKKKKKKKKKQTNKHAYVFKIFLYEGAGSFLRSSFFIKKKKKKKKKGGLF